MNRFLTIIHSLICTFIGFGEWYLITWFLTNQQDPTQWKLSVKIIYLIFAMVASDLLQKAEIKITIKNKKNE